MIVVLSLLDVFFVLWLSISLMFCSRLCLCMLLIILCCDCSLSRFVCSWLLRVVVCVFSLLCLSILSRVLLMVVMSGLEIWVVKKRKLWLVVLCLMVLFVIIVVSGSLVLRVFERVRMLGMILLCLNVY